LRVAPGGGVNGQAGVQRPKIATNASGARRSAGWKSREFLVDPVRRGRLCSTP
jgi:hypothetical protein